MHAVDFLAAAMAFLLKAISVGERFVTKGSVHLPKLGSKCSSFSMRAFSSATASPLAQAKETILADELFLRGWCGHTPAQRRTFPKPDTAASTVSSQPADPMEDFLLDELYSRGWFVAEAEVAHPSNDKVENGMHDELYVRGWLRRKLKISEMDPATKDALETELFARGWTWEASTLQVAKKITPENPVQEPPPPLSSEEEYFLDELFARGWEAAAAQRPLAAKKVPADTKDELFARGWA